MSRSIDEALTELEREAHIRLKCFDRWVEQGKLSWTDAFNRLEALLSAVKHLRDVQTALKIKELESLQPNQVADSRQMEAWASAAHAAIDNAPPENVVGLPQSQATTEPAPQREISA